MSNSPSPGAIDDTLPPLVLIGAHSRAGRAVLRCWPGEEVVAVHRDGGSPGVAVRDYTAVPDAVIPRAGIVVNCVGTPRGDEAELQRLNHDVALRWAEAAALAGARHFIQLSSFSVYGRIERIGTDTPERPGTAYGRSKLAADRALAASAIPVTLLRIPMLFGDGPDKLTQLVAAVRTAGMIPATRPPVQRSMLSYDALACAIVELALRPVAGVVPVADPTPFSYELLADTVAQVTGRRPRRIPLPPVLAGAIRKAAPPLHARLLASSLLDPDAALRFSMPDTATLPHALRSLVAG